MEKCILINSPIYEFATEENEDYLAPLGLGYIATMLQKVGIETKVLDCVKDRVPIRELISYLNCNKYSYIGVNIFSPNIKLVRKIVESIEYQCDIFIGGPVVKAIYLELLEWKTDCKVNIIIGEGELIIPDIILKQVRQKPEIGCGTKFVYRVNKDSVYYPRNLDTILLDRKLLGNPFVINHYGEKEAAIVTSRGCSYDCAFCGGAKGLNKDVDIRFRTKENICREIDAILENDNEVKSIRVLDDLFLRNIASVKSAVELFGGYEQLSWRAMAHVNTFVQQEASEIINGSNCREIFMGIESGDDSVRKKIRKMGSVEDVLQAATNVLGAGIDLKGYFILGFPNETKDNFDATYLLAERIMEISKNLEGHFRTSVFQFRPYHGTPLYNELIDGGDIIEDYTINNDISIINGRKQFNYQSGNYSLESDEILNDYILRIQQLR